MYFWFSRWTVPLRWGTITCLCIPPMPLQLVLRFSSSLMHLDEVNPSHLYIMPLCLCWSVSLCLPGVLTVFKEEDSLRCAPGGRYWQCSTDASCQTWELRGQRFGVARLHRHVAIKKPELVTLERGQAGQMITALWPPSSLRGHSDVITIVLSDNRAEFSMDFQFCNLSNFQNKNCAITYKLKQERIVWVIACFTKLLKNL